MALLFTVVPLLSFGAPTFRSPPMGWSSWNHYHMGVSAPVLLDTADAMAESGLRDAGYVYVNTDDGWNLFNRSAASGSLQTSPTFTNGTVKQLVAALHAKKFKFGIYLAAGFTTCGHRAGSLYHERDDAAWIAAAGVDYLKYDDCGEANIQSYAKYFVMKDALAAAYAAAERGEIDYYSYEPFQVYGRGAVPMMRWVSEVGNLWRSGGDIRAEWKSILGNAHANNHWAPNSKPGVGYNDADMLEIGNGDLTLAEQRSHFALWCLMKSPLIIGADVTTLAKESLAILKNAALIAVNQDSLGVQGTLVAAYDSAGTRAPTLPVGPVACVTSTTPCPEASPWMTHCDFGRPAAAAQTWTIVGAKKLTLQAGGGKNLCLARGVRRSEGRGATSDTPVSAVTCDASSPAQEWDFGGANETVAQVRSMTNTSECLTFNSTSLHVEACRKERGDKTTPNQSGCTDGNCRFSGLVYQLWYLNSKHQMTCAITNIDNHGDTLLPFPLPNFPPNTPWCLATSPSMQAQPRPPPPAVDTKMPRQIWAGPLAGGDVVVLLLNTGDNATVPMTIDFADVGLGGKKGLVVEWTDLWTGKKGTGTDRSITLNVAPHDSAALRLSPQTR